MKQEHVCEDCYHFTADPRCVDGCGFCSYHMENRNPYDSCRAWEEE